MKCGYESVDESQQMVPPARFQRATFRLGGGRSMQLSYGSTRTNSKSLIVNREIVSTYS